MLKIKHMNTLHDAILALKKKGIIKRDIEIAQATGYGKAAISEYKKGIRTLSDKFVDTFNNVYNKHGITLDKSPIVSESINNEQLAKMILSNSSISVASYNLLCRAVAVLENKPIEQVINESNEIATNKMDSFERLLNEMILIK